jgi:hypothetical protein
MNAEQELALVNAALEAILGGKVQSYSINGRQVTRLNLSELWNRKKELEATVARASSGGFFLARVRSVD